MGLDDAVAEVGIYHGGITANGYMRTNHGVDEPAIGANEAGLNHDRIFEHGRIRNSHFAFVHFEYTLVGEIGRAHV